MGSYVCVNRLALPLSKHGHSSGRIQGQEDRPHRIIQVDRLFF